MYCNYWLSEKVQNHSESNTLQKFAVESGTNFGLWIWKLKSQAKKKERKKKKTLPPEIEFFFVFFWFCFLSKNIFFFNFSLKTWLEIFEKQGVCGCSTAISSELAICSSTWGRRDLFWGMKPPQITKNLVKSAHVVTIKLSPLQSTNLDTPVICITHSVHIIHCCVSMIIRVLLNTVPGLLSSNLSGEHIRIKRMMCSPDKFFL